MRSASTGAPDVKCSMIAPRIAGLRTCQSRPSLVTVMKSLPKNTPETPGIANRRCARGELAARSEEHTSELQSLMRISYAVFCLKKQNKRIPYIHVVKHVARTHHISSTN